MTPGCEETVAYKEVLDSYHRCEAAGGLFDSFYKIFFAKSPEIPPMFAETDMKRQKAMLLSALVLVRKSLRDLDAIVPKLRQLGARHVSYGAEPEHYPVVAEVLIASMAAVAGPAWTPAYAQAWSEALGVVGRDARAAQHGTQLLAIERSPALHRLLQRAMRAKQRHGVELELRESPLAG